MTKSILTLESFIGDDSADTVLGVDGDVAEVSQGGGELDEQVTGQDSHPRHQVLRFKCKKCSDERDKSFPKKTDDRPENVLYVQLIYFKIKRNRHGKY